MSFCAAFDRRSLESDAMRNGNAKTWQTRGVARTLATLGIFLGLSMQAQADIAISISDGTNTLVCDDTTVLTSGCTVTSGTFTDTIGQTVDTTGAISPGFLVPTIVPGADGYGSLGDLDDVANQLDAESGGFGNWRKVRIEFEGETTSSLQTISSFVAESFGSSNAELTVMVTQDGLNTAGPTVEFIQDIDFNFIGSSNPDTGDAFVDYALYADAGNVQFAQTELVYEENGVSGFGGENDILGQSALGIWSGDYSLTQVFFISHDANGTSTRTTSFSSTLALPAPEPAVIGLLGIGLILTAVGARRRAGT